MDVQKRIDELTEQLNYHAKKYYTEDAPEITDYEYDMLSRELRAGGRIPPAQTRRFSIFPHRRPPAFGVCAGGAPLSDGEPAGRFFSAGASRF